MSKFQRYPCGCNVIFAKHNNNVIISKLFLKCDLNFLAFPNPDIVNSKLLLTRDYSTFSIQASGTSSPALIAMTTSRSCGTTSWATWATTSWSTTSTRSTTSELPTIPARSCTTVPSHSPRFLGLSLSTCVASTYTFDLYELFGYLNESSNNFPPNIIKKLDSN